MSIFVICGALALGGCGGTDSATSGADGSQIPVQSGEEAEERTRPEVTVPPTPPPKRLVVKDLIEGSGDEEAQDGDKITILYVGTSWTGGPYADSWAYSAPPSFTLGEKTFELGLEEGIRGMKAGGRREVLVPHTRIYAGEGPSGLSPADSIVFVVDLLDVG
jgi:FKBP-type peptidyl-prolyl cis-trans isomerase